MFTKYLAEYLLGIVIFWLLIHYVISYCKVTGEKYAADAFRTCLKKHVSGSYLKNHSCKLCTQIAGMIFQTLSSILQFAP